MPRTKRAEQVETIYDALNRVCSRAASFTAIATPKRSSRKLAMALSLDGYRNRDRNRFSCHYRQLFDRTAGCVQQNSRRKSDSRDHVLHR